MRTNKMVGKRKKSVLKRHVSSNSMPMRTNKMVGKRKKSVLKRHVSSNSTWAKVSEKLKVDRYYMCPYSQSKIEKTYIAKNQDLTLKEPVESPIHITPVTEKKLKEAETVQVESVIFPESVEDIEAIEPPVLVAASETIEPNEIKSVQTKYNQCKYSFGYLQNRKTGEEIPETCLDCPKSVDCVLSNLNPSRALA